MEEILEMSRKELERIRILAQVVEGKITQLTAAKILKLSDRQVRNLLVEFKTNGEKGIISKKRGKLKNHCISKPIKDSVLNLICNHYSDFGPTLANEYLKSQHNIQISDETVRQWMIETHFWIPRIKQKKLHPPRERRSHFGELIQIDGSHHDWFEGRAEPCVLMVAVDDATSLITSLYFSHSESLQAYLETLRHHLQTYGIPRAFYGDKCSVNVPRILSMKSESTQFKKILKELDCELILAHSPQAKGRVERVNRTLQDRLIKEMRIKAINTLEAANEFLEEFRENYNAKFAKKPGERTNAHRPLNDISLAQVLCVRETRILSKDFTIQFNNIFYQIEEQEKKVHLHKGAQIEIRNLQNGNKIALLKGVIVKMTALMDVETEILDNKQMKEWKIRNQYLPPASHPYKKPSYERMLKGKHEMRYGT